MDFQQIFRHSSYRRMNYVQNDITKKAKPIHINSRAASFAYNRSLNYRLLDHVAEIKPIRGYCLVFNFHRTKNAPRVAKRAYKINRSGGREHVLNDSLSEEACPFAGITFVCK